MVKIENHSTIDKSFEVSTDHLSMIINFDDVNHEEVEAATIILKELIEMYWDEDSFKSVYKQQLIKRWVKDKYLQEDYQYNLDNYLKDTL